MANSPITSRARIGLSTANPVAANPTAITAADMVASGQNPTQVIARSQASGGGGTLRFPLDIPQYFMIFTINAYNRADWATVGTLNAESTIALPLPIQMTDESKVHYESEPLGLAGAAGFAAAKGNGRVAEDRAVGAGVMAGVGALGGTAQSVLAGATQALGYAVNAFDTVMLKGPTYKSHTFTWILAPNSTDESRAISNIKGTFDGAKAPGLAGGLTSAFFTWPKIFNIAYKHAGGADMGARLNRFKPCVLTDVKVSFTPGDRPPAFFAASKAIESVELTLSFLELEYWLAGDPDFDSTW